MSINIQLGVANMALEEADLPRVDILVAALSSTLWVLEHPDVNAIRFAGSPRGLASRIRPLIEAFHDGAIKKPSPVVTHDETQGLRAAMAGLLWASESQLPSADEGIEAQQAWAARCVAARAAARFMLATPTPTPAPEARKPLTEDDILRGVRAARDAGLCVNFAQGVKFAEREHGIQHPADGAEGGNRG